MDDAVLIETWIELPDLPDWRPLVAVARLSRASDALLTLDEQDFMYMAAALSVDGALTIHLYKHRETRRYLNLDDAGHAYRYCGPVPWGHGGSDERDVPAAPVRRGGAGRRGRRRSRLSTLSPSLR